MFEIKVSRKIFESERNWRRLNNEELHDLYFLANIIRMIKMMYHVWRRGEVQVRYREVKISRPSMMLLWAGQVKF